MPGVTSCLLPAARLQEAASSNTAVPQLEAALRAVASVCNNNDAKRASEVMAKGSANMCEAIVWALTEYKKVSTCRVQAQAWLRENALNQDGVRRDIQRLSG